MNINEIESFWISEAAEALQVSDHLRYRFLISKHGTQTLSEISEKNVHRNIQKSRSQQ